MSESDVTTYQNNLTYRCQIQLIEESFPQRANDPEVESVSSYRNVRRNSQTMKDSEISEIQKKETLSEALKDIKKAQTRRSIYNSLNQSQIQTPLKVNYLSPITRKITQQLIDQSEINTISHIEEQEQKVVPIRLMRILKMLTNNTRIFNKLSLQQHTLVGDIVSVYQKNKLTTNLTNSTRFSKFVSNVLNYTNLITQIFKLPIFAPSSKFIRIWDSMISILILFSTLLLNLQLFFTMPIEQFSSLFQLLFAFSIIDIFIELNTGIVQKGNVNFNRDFILKTYCKKTLIFDIFGNIPLFSFMINMEIGMKFQIFINILFIFKWIKIQKIFKWLSFYISYEKNNKNVFDLIRLLFFIIGVCHVFCLFWHGLALFEINNGKVDTWIHQKNLILSSIYERYTYSFYFLAVTMITVGYGDITPQNPLEILFTTCTIFITCIVYAFSLNTIGSIIENIEKKDKKYKENMQIIHGLMRDENVSRELRIKVSNYIEYLYKESNEVLKKQEKIIINKLSAKLRNDLTLEIQGKYLSNIPLFKNLKEKDKVSNIMEEHLYSPGEIIFNQGDIDDCSLYYIVKGNNTAEIQKREDLVVSNKGKQEYFGEISFINGNPRSLSAKAFDFCRVYKIQRDKFLQIIKENDQDYENFQMIKEAISLNNNYKFCSIHCSICKSGNHFSIHCPRTHLTLTKQVVIYRYNHSIPHIERIQFQRNRKRLNYFQSIRQMQEALLDINQNESMFEILDEIELGCNFIDMTEDEEYSDIEITTLKKTGEEQEANIQPKYQRYRTSESNKIKQHLLNLTYLGNDDQLSPLPDQQKSSPSRQVLFSEKQNSSHSLSSRQSDQLHIQTQQKKSLMAPVVSQANNQEEEKKAASDLESSQSSSDSSSQSSDSSKVTSQKMSTNNSFGEGKKNNKDQLQMKQFINFNLPNEKKEEDVKSPFNKMSLIQIKQIETDKSAVQSSNIFNFAPNSNKINSQTRLPSKITQELDKVDERGIQIQQPNSLKNFEKKEIGDAVLTRQLSNNINVANKQSSIIINDFQQAQQQTDNQRNQTFDKFKIGRVIVNSQFGSRRTMRETKAGNQLELIQQSVIAFLNQQQQKKSKIFNDIVDNQQIKKLQALTNLGKNQQDNKQATNKSIVVPSFLNPLQVEENPVKLEQKIQEIIEPPDQVNYTMLQTFDKAKIFKFYNPHFNYLEIVKKWIILQNKFQKIYFQNKRSLPKKKARHQKSKRKFQEF